MISRFGLIILLGLISVARSDWLVAGNCITENPYAFEVEVSNGNCAPMDNTRGSNPTQWLNLFCAPDGKYAVAYECSDPKCRQCVAKHYDLKFCDASGNYFDCFPTKPNISNLLGTDNFGVLGFTADNCTTNYKEKAVALDRCIPAVSFGLKLTCSKGRQIFTEYNDSHCGEEISHEVIPLGCSKDVPGTDYACSGGTPELNK